MLYEGNPKGEPLQDFWRRSVRYSQDEKWMLSFLSATGRFVNLKLYALKPVHEKANYWLSARTDSETLKDTKFGRYPSRLTQQQHASTDLALLRQHRSDLYDEIEEYLENDYFGGN